MKAIIPFFLLLILVSNAADQWPRFRGPDGRGTSSTTLPMKLTKSNLKWSFTLSGNGSSSPVVWGEKLFILAENKGKSVNLYCLNSTTGKEIWKESLNTGEYHTHKFNNQAASTPALTENEVVATWFDAKDQSGKLAVYNHTGKKLWEMKVGAFDGQHGFTINPSIAKDYLVISHLHRGESYIGAFDVKTGKPIWKVKCPSEDVAYSTPLIRLLADGTREVIVTGPSIGMMCINFEDGKVKWQQKKAHDKRTVNSPFEVVVNGSSYITGSQKDKQYTAVKLPGSKNKEAEIHWQERKIGSYVPCHLSIDNRLFILQDNGALTEYDFINKKRVDQIKLSGDCYTSPILVKNYIYCVTRSGVLEVIDVTKGMKNIQTLDLNPPENTLWVDATPAAVNNSLFIRLGNRLDCYK